MSLEFKKKTDAIIALVEEFRNNIKSLDLKVKSVPDYKAILEKFNAEMMQINKAYDQSEALLRKIIGDQHERIQSLESELSSLKECKIYLFQFRII